MTAEPFWRTKTLSEMTEGSYRRALEVSPSSIQSVPLGPLPRLLIRT